MPPLMMPAPQLQALFDAGPVLLGLDGDDPAHRDLPPCCAGHFVVVPLVGHLHLDAMARGEARMAVEFAHNLADGVADLSLHDAVAVIGRLANGQVAPAVNPAQLARLGPVLPLLMQELLAGLRLVPPQPVWTLPSSAQEWSLAMATAEPSKPRALQLAQQDAKPVWLALRLGVPGMKLAQVPAESDSHALLLVPETQELSVGEAGVGWKQASATGTVEAMFLPWQAIWALRSWDMQRGHLWLCDAPPSILALPQVPVVDRDALRRYDGAAMPPPPTLKPTVILAPPQHWPPQQALRWGLQQGPMLVIVDAAGQGVRVPPGLRQQPIVALGHGIGLSTTLIHDDDGIVANLPDADGRPAALRAPWSAVVGLQVLAPFLQAAWTWPEHVSTALQHTLHADADGCATLTLQQPCGPATPAGRPAMEIQLRIERLDVN